MRMKRMAVFLSPTQAHGGNGHTFQGDGRKLHLMKIP